MSRISAKVIRYLMEHNLTISCAESCTGGLIAAEIVKYDGVSSIFSEGHVTYANEAKIEYLSVSDFTLRRFGAVSRETAYEMALGLHHKTKADLTLCSTGIAGPTGGTESKPVGLVYLSCYYNGQVCVREYHFHGNRQMVRMQARDAAFRLSYDMIKEASK